MPICADGRAFRSRMAAVLIFDAAHLDCRPWQNCDVLPALQERGAGTSASVPSFSREAAPSPQVLGAGMEEEACGAGPCLADPGWTRQDLLFHCTNYLRFRLIFKQLLYTWGMADGSRKLWSSAYRRALRKWSPGKGEQVALFGYPAVMVESLVWWTHQTALGLIFSARWGR